VRLVLPITLLIFLAGLTFWAEYGGRVDSTITLLLSVSALYIVILANIPLLGYLTAIDTYIFWMFLMLIFTCVLHQMYATLSEKIDVYPLRPIILRLLETVGRLGIFPTVTGFYITTVQEIAPGFDVTMITIVTVACVYIASKEIVGLRSTTRKSLHALLDKINSPESKLDNITTGETIVFNWWKFRKLSNSPMHIARLLSEQGEIAPPGSDTVKLRNLQALHELTRDSAVTTTGKSPREISLSVLSENGRSNSIAPKTFQREGTAGEQNNSSHGGFTNVRDTYRDDEAKV